MSHHEEQLLRKFEHFKSESDSGKFQKDVCWNVDKACQKLDDFHAAKRGPSKDTRGYSGGRRDEL